MCNEMTFPHTFENGITILRKTRNGALMITDGMTVAYIIKNYIRPNGTLTNCGMRSLLDSTLTYEQYLEQNRRWKEKIEQEKKAREEQRIKDSELITYIINPGILFSAGSTYKYAYGKGRDLYYRPCTHYNHIPKSQLNIKRANGKVYVTLPKWLANNHPYIFTTVTDLH